MSVILETTFGDVVIDLFTKERPKCCLNFLKLCKIKYYNYCVIHNVQKNFVMQTGDPSGKGRGGESVHGVLYGEQAKYFEAEKRPKLKHVNTGTVSMVNNGENMHGSQFLITLGDNLDYLDDVHTVFGEVAEGTDVLMKINETICDEDNRPYIDIRINHSVVLDDPYPDPKGLEVPERSPEPTREQLETGRIAADEELDETKGKSMEEIEEEIKAKEAGARAQVLEMIGDLPDADVKPPENVLFVCKLNPVTSDDDLEIIFSRFGPILSCEVIRDKKSGESLQYAFIEFENESDCEKAFFKMDNVLIDDRRIHVDFSQSVSKMKWQQRRGIKTSEGKQNVKSLKDYDEMEKSRRKKDGHMSPERAERKRGDERGEKRRSEKSPGRRERFGERGDDERRFRRDGKDSGRMGEHRRDRVYREDKRDRGDREDRKGRGDKRDRDGKHREHRRDREDYEYIDKRDMLAKKYRGDRRGRDDKSGREGSRDRDTGKGRTDNERAIKKRQKREPSSSSSSSDSGRGNRSKTKKGKEHFSSSDDSSGSS